MECIPCVTEGIPFTFQAPLMYFLDNLGEWDAFEDTGGAAVKHIVTYLGFGTLSRFVRTV